MQATQIKLPASTDGYVMELTTGKFDGEDQISYTTYGICLKSSSGEILKEYKDISTSKVFVERFIASCKEHGAAAIHIQDLLEDYLD